MDNWVEVSEERVIEGRIEEGPECLLMGKKDHLIPKNRAPMPGCAADKARQREEKKKERERQEAELKAAQEQLMLAEKLARLDKYRTDPIPPREYVKDLIKHLLGKGSACPPQGPASIYTGFVNGYVSRIIQEIEAMPEEFGLTCMADEKAFEVVYLKVRKFLDNLKREQYLQNRGKMSDEHIEQARQLKLQAKIEQEEAAGAVAGEDVCPLSPGGIKLDLLPPPVGEVTPPGEVIEGQLLDFFTPSPKRPQFVRRASSPRALLPSAGFVDYGVPPEFQDAIFQSPQAKRLDESGVEIEEVDLDLENPIDAEVFEEMLYKEMEPQILATDEVNRRRKELRYEKEKEEVLAHLNIRLMSIESLYDFIDFYITYDEEPDLSGDNIYDSLMKLHLIKVYEDMYVNPIKYGMKPVTHDLEDIRNVLNYVAKELRKWIAESLDVVVRSDNVVKALRNFHNVLNEVIANPSMPETEEEGTIRNLVGFLSKKEEMTEYQVDWQMNKIVDVVDNELTQIRRMLIYISKSFTESNQEDLGIRDFMMSSLEMIDKNFDDSERHLEGLTRVMIDGYNNHKQKFEQLMDGTGDIFRIFDQSVLLSDTINANKTQEVVNSPETCPRKLVDMVQSQVPEGRLRKYNRRLKAAVRMDKKPEWLVEEIPPENYLTGRLKKILDVLNHLLTAVTIIDAKEETSAKLLTAKLDDVRSKFERMKTTGEAPPMSNVHAYMRGQYQSGGIVGYKQHEVGVETNLSLRLEVVSNNLRMMNRLLRDVELNAVENEALQARLANLNGNLENVELELDPTVDQNEFMHRDMVYAEIPDEERFKLLLDAFLADIENETTTFEEALDRQNAWEVHISRYFKLAWKGLGADDRPREEWPLEEWKALFTTKASEAIPEMRERQRIFRGLIGFDPAAHAARITRSKVLEYLDANPLPDSPDEAVAIREHWREVKDQVRREQMLDVLELADSDEESMDEIVFADVERLKRELAPMLEQQYGRFKRRGVIPEEEYIVNLYRDFIEKQVYHQAVITMEAAISRKINAF